MNRSSLNLGDLVEHWTLVGAERDLVVGKHRDTQVGFALMLKFYGRFGRFPRGRAELHPDAVEFVAKQLGADSGSLGFYEWSGRTIKRHRAEIRAHLGFRECTVADAKELTGWLAGDYALIKAAPGNVSLASMLTEISRLKAVRAIGLPAGLFSDVAPKVLAAWRSRASVESPSHLRDHGDELTLTLLAALVYCRTWEVTDALVTLLIRTVHAIGARAERRVTQKLVAEFRRVHGKENLLFRVAEAATARPDGTVREVVFPVVGEDNLRNLVAEYKSSGSTYRRTLATTYRASYSNHYRRGLIRLLEVLEFRCENSHRPVLDALALVHRHRRSTDLTYYPVGEQVPVHAGLSGDWAELAWRTDKPGQRRTVRTVYEIRTFEACATSSNARASGWWGQR